MLRDGAGEASSTGATLRWATVLGAAALVAAAFVVFLARLGAAAATAFSLALALVVVVGGLLADRARIADRLRRSEARLREVYENASDIVVRLAPEGTLLDVSPTIARVLGHEAEALVGLPGHVLVHADDAPAVSAAFAELATGRASSAGFRARCADGTYRWVVADGRPILDGSGAVREIVFTVRDVHEQTETREALRESDANWRRILENAPEVVTMLDAEGRILYANRAIGNLRIEQVLGLFAPGLLQGEARVRFWGALEKARSSRNATEFEGSTSFDGVERWWRSTISAIRREDEVTGFLLFSSEITERRRAQVELKESQARYRQLSDATREGIVVHKDQTILEANRAFADLFDARVEDLRGRHLLDLFDEASRALLVETNATLGDDTHALSLFRADGAPLELEVTGHGMTWSGHAARVVAVVDVAERRRLEREAATQRDALARSEQLSALGTLVAGVAHEINNPLTYIAGNVELALLDLADMRASPEAKSGTIESATRSLEAALGGTERIARIVKALREVARARPAGERERVRLNAIVRNVEELMRVGLPGNVEAEFEVDASDPVVVANASEMHQIVLNLTKNALEALGAKGGRVRVQVRREGDSATLRVEDDGPGIPPEVAQRLFTPFFTTKSGGTGLGLSIVHGIVQDHGGDIRLESGPGEGARFAVRLPLAAPVPTA